MLRPHGRLLLLVVACALGGCSAPASAPPDPNGAGEGVGPTTAPPLDAYGRIIYVPAYSHIYHARHNRDFQLTVTLSVRNPYPDRSLTVTRIDYFDSMGDFVRGHLDGPRVLRPLETLEVIVAEDDESGGSGANFLVGWLDEGEGWGPLAEAVMIGTSGGQGLSFVSRGSPLPPG